MNGTRETVVNIATLFLELGSAPGVTDSTLIGVVKGDLRKLCLFVVKEMRPADAAIMQPLADRGLEAVEAAEAAQLNDARLDSKTLKKLADHAYKILNKITPLETKSHFTGER
jgi:hypothetical protein